MKLNTKTKERVFTHEGGRATKANPVQELERTVMSCLLWEKDFYEDGISIADRIASLCAVVTIGDIQRIARKAKHQMHLRHVPLLLAALAAQKSANGIRSLGISDLIDDVIQRADEPAEFLAIYRKINGSKKTPLSKQVKLGLAKAMLKFDAYQLAKYDRDGEFRLRDVIRLVHPKPTHEEQSQWFKTLSDGEKLPTPDTWETALSAGADKKETFERLLRENKLGYLALLRNLRNMVEAGVDFELMSAAIKAGRGADRVLPMRYIAAARACPLMEEEIDEALLGRLANMPKLPGHTLILVDHSGSMQDRLSSRSDLTRFDAAAGLAAIWPGDVNLFTFSYDVALVPPRKGMACVDALHSSMGWGGTNLWKSLNSAVASSYFPSDRIVVITDEQTSDHYGAYKNRLNVPSYMINVGTSKNGIAYRDGWTSISGFSENIIRYIAMAEGGVDIDAMNQ